MKKIQADTETSISMQMAIAPTSICQMPDEIGGHVAVSDVPENYDGTCIVYEDNGSDRMIAVMPSYEEARRVAHYAVSVDGGFGSVRVSAAPGVTPTHGNFNDWAF